MNQRTLLSGLLAAIFVTLAGTAFAEPTDDNCRNVSGQRINTHECIAFFKAQQPLSDTECFSSPACRAETEARNAARQAKRDGKNRLEQEAEDRVRAAADRKAAMAAAPLKAKCGEDYKKPRIGMTLDRVRECVSTSFKESGQTNTDQGVVTTYRAPGGYLHVIDGKVVQWGKF